MPAPPRQALSPGIGLRAEMLARWLLLFKGYRVLDSRYRAAGGEIDLIVQRGEVVAFVEVKARATIDDAHAAITPQKRRRIARVVRTWLGANRWAVHYTLRCDAVFCGRRALPKHVRDVFPLDLDRVAAAAGR